MTEQLAQTFAALADPTRLAILEQLSRGEASVSALAKPFEISMPAISRHLKVLEQAGLVARTRQAQWRPVQLNAAPLAAVSGWLERYRGHWDTQFNRMDAYLAELQKGEPDGPQQ